MTWNSRLLSDELTKSTWHVLRSWAGFSRLIATWRPFALLSDYRIEVFSSGILSNNAHDDRCTVIGKCLGRAFHELCEVVKKRP